MNMNSTSSGGANVPNATKKITKFEQAEHVHRQLLYDLMSSIYEYILILTSHARNNSETVAETGFRTSEAHTSTDNRITPNVESLLLHIHSCLEQIFLNGLRIFKPDVSKSSFLSTALHHLICIELLPNEIRSERGKVFKIRIRASVSAVKVVIKSGLYL